MNVPNYKGKNTSITVEISKQKHVNIYALRVGTRVVFKLLCLRSWLGPDRVEIVRLPIMILISKLP